MNIKLIKSYLLSICCFAVLFASPEGKGFVGQKIDQAIEVRGECDESFMTYGSDQSGSYYGACWSDGTGYYSFVWEGGCLATGIEYSGGFIDISSYGFTEGFFFYGFEPGSADTFVMTFDDGTSGVSENVANDCASCEDLGQVTCWDSSCADTLDDCPEEGDCGAGYVIDCVDTDCCPESWIGDGYADCEDQAYGCDLTCYDNDGGDCSGDTTGGTTGDTTGGSADCEACDLDYTNYGSECCDTAWGEYGIDCATLEAEYGWDCSGCACPGDGETGGTTGGTTGDGGCDAGYVEDCVDDDCCPESWIGDGFEDCADQAYGCDLTCYDNDGGDCPEACEGVTCWDGSCADTEEDCPEQPDAPNAPGEVCVDGSQFDVYGDGNLTPAVKITWTNDNDAEACGEGYVDDCDGSGECCPESWIGDGFEDCEDQQFGCDLTCYDNDGGDCGGDPTTGGTTGDTTGGGECDAGYVDDCSGDGDCCPESWIGDGFEDCEDQAYGCDLTCYDSDGGDCGGDPTTGGTTGDTTGGGECDAGYVDDCSGDGDCCPESWIGDGFEDCEDQAYGCDLTCYDSDGGDCGPAGPSCEDEGLVTCWDGSCADTADDCPEAPSCADSFTVSGSDGVTSCYSDGTGYYVFAWEGGCLMTAIEYSGGYLDVTSYGFTEGFSFYGFVPGECDTFVAYFEGGEVAASEEVCNDCATCEENGQVTCWDASCADTLDDCPEEGECAAGYVIDCVDLDCCPESWIGDGYADCEDQAYGCDLTCYDNDGGDCGPSESCEDQGLVTCFDGTCAETIDDCESGCPDGTIADCDGSGDCCYDTWLGDGYCDDVPDSPTLCDLTCYDNDNGDCDGRAADYAGVRYKAGQEPSTFVKSSHSLGKVLHGRTVDVIRAADRREPMIAAKQGSMYVPGSSEVVRIGEATNAGRAVFANIHLTCDACLSGGPYDGYFTSQGTEIEIYGMDDGSTVTVSVALCSDLSGVCSDEVGPVMAEAGIADGDDCVGEGNDCPSAGTGDVNGDGSSDVLDIVQIVNVILGGAFNDDCAASSADINGDGSADVLDIVQIVNMILGGRADIGDATSAKIIHVNNVVSIDANGYIGAVQMTLNHGNDFSIIDLTDNALVADYSTNNNETILVIVKPEEKNLFSHIGDFEIADIKVVNSSDYIEVIAAPAEFNLSSAYPNPFNPTTSLTLSMPDAGYVSVQVYNIMGQVVATLASGYMDASTYTLTWDASDVSSGMYFVKAEAAGSINVQKLVLMK